MLKTIIYLLLTMIIISGCSSLNPDELPQGLTKEIKNTFNQRILTNKKLLRDESEDLVAMFEVAYSYHLLGDYDQAIRYYNKILKLAPKHFTALNNSADIYEQAGKYELASERIKVLYETNPDNSEVISDTVRILVLNGEFESAQSALENFIKVRSDQNKETTPEFISGLYDFIVNSKSNQRQ